MDKIKKNALIIATIHTLVCAVILGVVIHLFGWDAVSLVAVLYGLDARIQIYTSKYEKKASLARLSMLMRREGK